MQSLSSPHCLYLNFCAKIDTKLVNDTQQSIVVVVETLPAGSCTACHKYSALICNIRPNTTQRRSVEKVPIDDWQASFTLILLVFHRLDLAS